VFTLRVRRVWIEKAECTGHTLCVPEAPGLIEYDADSDVSVVKESALQRTHPELKALLDASEVCPMDAFFVETEDGSVFNVSRNDDIRRAVREGRYTWASKA
jgi:ferredoxin